MNANNRDEMLAQTKVDVLNMLKKTIRPEFLNRIDEIIMFLPLTKNEIGKVVELQMGAVQKMLQQQGFNLEWTPQAINYLCDKGYNPEFGARPVKRAIQRYVLNDLSKKLLAGDVVNDKTIKIDASATGLVFSN